MSGGTCDTMDGLQAALERGLTGIAMGPLCDPEAVARLIAAGEGAEVDVDLGNQVPLDRIGLHQKPLRLHGTVRAVSDGSYTVTGPIYTGQRCHMGRTVLFDTGSAQIVVSEQTHEPWDLVVCSTAWGWIPRASGSCCSSHGCTAGPVFHAPFRGPRRVRQPGGRPHSDYARFPFKRVRRPVYPLDPA